MNIELNSNEQEKINLAKEYYDKSQHYVIEGQADYSYAAHQLKVIKAKKLEYDLMRKRLKAPIIKAGKEIEEFFRAPITYLMEAEQAYKKAMVCYKEVEEKKILQASIEYRQKQQELANKALDALEQGDTENYEEYASNIVNLQQPEAMTKIDGISYRDNWKGKVVDLSKLIMAIATGHAPLSIIKIDESALNQLAKSTKGTMSYPGIVFYNDKVVVSK